MTRQTALFLSPHLDDAVFSAGGLAARLAHAGWRVVIATAFTRSVVPAQGFALACQLDKGLPPEADYMALRRAEDAAAARMLGAETRWLDLLEAPHRDYDSPADLFGVLREDDAIGSALANGFAALDGELLPDLVLAPLGLGNHVDHQQVILMALGHFGRERLTFWRDTPYAIRQPEAPPHSAVATAPSMTVRIGPVLDAKIAAAQAYATQIGFQFGGGEKLAASLRQFACAEGQGTPAERFAGRAIPLDLCR